MTAVFDLAENIVEKGESAGTVILSLFSIVFKCPLLLDRLNVW